MSKSQPLYQKLAEELIDKIKSNELTTGTSLLSERKLCQEYSVSRMTVRQALSEMERRGYIDRRHGSGTYISRPAVNTNLSSFYSLSSEMRRLGFKVHSRVIRFAKTACTKHVAEALQVKTPCDVFQVTRLRYLEDNPFVYEISYIPVEFCPGLNKQGILENGLYKTLEMLSGIVITSAKETFEAVMPPKTVIRHLELGDNLPTLHLIRIAYDKNGVVEYCDCYIRGDMYKYTIFMR